MRRGGGVGYDFSSIRPQRRRGAGHAARARAARSPTCACSTAPARRSSPPARAAARRWACCAATTPTSRSSSTPRTRATCTNFNISVGVTDAFMRAVEHDARVRARAQGASPRPTAKAAAPARRRPVGLPQGAGRATCGSRSCARPTTTPSRAILFLDRINRDNNLAYCETHRGDQSLRRAAAAALRLLLPRHRST